MNAAAARKAIQTADLHACACGGFTAVDAAGRETRIACNATTKRTFAPGHDARLKGFLIRAGVEGLLIRTPWGGADQSPERVADHFGFGHMVTDGVNRGKDREWAKLLKATKKQAKATHETPKQVTCKVGRWTYEGVIADSPEWGPQFTYTSAKGVQTTTTKFIRV